MLSGPGVLPVPAAFSNAKPLVRILKAKVIIPRSRREKLVETLPSAAHAARTKPMTMSYDRDSCLSYHGFAHTCYG